MSAVDCIKTVPLTSANGASRQNPISNCQQGPRTLPTEGRMCTWSQPCLRWCSNAHRTHGFRCRQKLRCGFAFALAGALATASSPSAALAAASSALAFSMIWMLPMSRPFWARTLCCASPLMIPSPTTNTRTIHHRTTDTLVPRKTARGKMFIQKASPRVIFYRHRAAR